MDFAQALPSNWVAYLRLRTVFLLSKKPLAIHRTLLHAKWSPPHFFSDNRHPIVITHQTNNKKQMNTVATQNMKRLFNWHGASQQPTERILHQESKLVVPVWNMALASRESRNDITERTQALVNWLGLLQVKSQVMPAREKKLKLKADSINLRAMNCE